MSSVALTASTASRIDSVQAEARFVELDMPPVVWLTAQDRQALAGRHEDSNTAPVLAVVRSRGVWGLTHPPALLQASVYGWYVGSHPDRMRSVRHMCDMLVWRSLTCNSVTRCTTTSTASHIFSMLRS